MILPTHRIPLTTLNGYSILEVPNGYRQGVLMVREDKLKVHIWFDRKLVQHLDRFANKWGISRSELIRVAVASFLEQGKRPLKREG